MSRSTVHSGMGSRDRDGWGPIPYDSTIRESRRGHSMYLAQALEQPLILLKDMKAFKRMRQPDLFISLKLDLAMVSAFP